MVNHSAHKKLWVFVTISLSLLTVIAVIRSLFIGIDIDEEYAMSVAYRLAKGDLLIKEMWEPHQLSALIPALFIKLFLIITNGTTGMMIYLRVIGCLFQLMVSILWYQTISKLFTKESAVITAFIIFNTLPKWMMTLEFANQQILFLILIVVFLLRYFESGKTTHVVIAGICMAFEVLAYPSCVFLFIFYFCVLLWKNYKHALLFMATCVLLGVIFMTYILSQMSLSELLTSLKYITDDPTHSSDYVVRAYTYLYELSTFFKYLVIYLAIAIFTTLIFWILRLKCNKLYVFATSLLLSSMIHQVYFWVSKKVPHVHMQIHYMYLFFVCFVIYMAKLIVTRSSEKWRNIFLLTWWPSVIAYLSILALTNLDLRASFVHLLPGMLCGIVIWMDDDHNDFIKYAIPTMWVIMLIMARIILIRSDDGKPINLFDDRVKLTSGPLAGISCEAVKGERFNSDFMLVDKFLHDGDNVLYVGRDTSKYLYKDFNICGASLISTPIYTKRYIDYFYINPNKKPDYIIIDKAYFATYEEKMPEFISWINSNFDLSNQIESEYLYILYK